MKVLVTDGHNRVALAVVRALGRAGADVTVVEQERFASRTPASFSSRHAARHEVLPSLETEGAFIEALARAARGHDVLIPVSTNVLMACARNLARLPVRVPIPPHTTLRRANDKSSVLAVARKAGVPVPVSYAPESDEELEEVIAQIRYPVVVKLRDDEGTWLEPRQRYAVAEDGARLRAAYRILHRRRPFPVIQERIRGDGYGVGVLARDGKILASFCHRREREYPVTGGPSALCVSVRDDRLSGYAAALIAELRWTGAAMVEFKKDDDYRLLEVNPRFWGSLPLATRAGINFPHLLCRMAMGEEFAPATEYPAGVKVRFLPLDLPAALSAVGMPGLRGRYVGGFLRDLLDRSVTDGIFDITDPWSSLAYIIYRLPGGPDRAAAEQGEVE